VKTLTEKITDRVLNSDSKIVLQVCLKVSRAVDESAIAGHYRSEYEAGRFRGIVDEAINDALTAAETFKDYQWMIDRLPGVMDRVCRLLLEHRNSEVKKYGEWRHILDKIRRICPAILTDLT